MRFEAYRFGDFRFEPASGAVTDGSGRSFELRGKACSLLTYLIENRDRTVSKDKLLAAIWRGRVVEDQAVFQVVSELRHAFAGLETIRTHRGKGYRWVAATYVTGGSRCARAPMRPAGMRLAISVLLTLTAALVAASSHLEGSTASTRTVQIDSLLLNEARSHAIAGRLEAAEAVLRIALSSKPEHAEANLELGSVLLATGKTEAARHRAYGVYERSADGSRERAESALLLSRILASEGRHDQADRFGALAVVLASKLEDIVLVAASQEQIASLSEARGMWDAADANLLVAQQIYAAHCPENASRVSRIRERLARQRDAA